MSTPFAMSIAEAVRQSWLGGRTYAVGGAVRDGYLGLSSKDTDLLVCGVPHEALRGILAKLGKVDFVGESFGVFKVTHDGETIDVALPRTEVRTGQTQSDFDVRSDPSLPIEADLARRDFTMNAIAIDLLSHEVIDPFGGVQDIRDGVVRAVGNPQERFDEDPLRILRAIRFVAKTGFRLDSQTWNAMYKMAGELSSERGRVAPERIQEELVRTLSYNHARGLREALRAMTMFGVLKAIIPEMEAAIGFSQNNPYHDKTVLDHVFTAVEYAVSRGFSPRARLAVFFHDIAKPATYSCDESGGHFYKHEDLGADMTTAVMARLRFPAQDIADVSKIVREHLRPQNNNDKTLRRFAAEMGDLLDDALACRESDLAAHAPHVAATARIIVDDFRARIATLPSHVKGFTAADVALRGDVIAKTFKVSGRSIGEIKKRCAAAIVDGLVPNEEAALIKFVTESTPGTGA